MFRAIIILLVSLSLIACNGKEKKFNEKHYQTELCNKLGGEMEVVLKDKTRVDCLTDEYAIEVDFAKKWAEGIGQSLYYAEMTGKKPAIGLIMIKDSDSRYLKRLNHLAGTYSIKIFILSGAD